MTMKQFHAMISLNNSAENKEKYLASKCKTLAGKEKHLAKAHEYHKIRQDLMWYWKHGEYFAHFQFEPFKIER